MDRVKVSLYAAALTVLISGLWWGPYILSAKERPGSSGIPPEKATAYIYAVIKGSAINNDGSRKVGFTAPSVEGQAEVIRRAYQVAASRAIWLRQSQGPKL